jgi:hypothetical protein
MCRAACARRSASARSTQVRRRRLSPRVAAGRLLEVWSLGDDRRWRQDAHGSTVHELSKRLPDPVSGPTGGRGRRFWALQARPIATWSAWRTNGRTRAPIWALQAGPSATWSGWRTNKRTRRLIRGLRRPPFAAWSVWRTNEAQARKDALGGRPSHQPRADRISAARWPANQASFQPKPSCWKRQRSSPSRRLRMWLISPAW